MSFFTIIINRINNTPTDNNTSTDNIFKIINITTINRCSKNLTLHLISEDNKSTEVVSLNTYYNIVTAKITAKNDTINIIFKLLTETVFNHKMRPLNVKLLKNSNSLLWGL